MLTTTILAKQLEQYQQLCFHQCVQLCEQLQLVQAIQKQRIQQANETLFKNQHYQQIAAFLLEHFYSQPNLALLAQQLDKALQEKIKLDRFLPQHVLDAAIAGFDLAYLTLKLDEQIAQYLIDQQLAATPAHIQQALISLNQLNDRQLQLDLLAKLSSALNQYSRNFFIQSAFRFAKNTAYRRQFNFLYDYLAQAFRAVRATPQAKHFFKQLIEQEKLFLAQTFHPSVDIIEPTTT